MSRLEDDGALSVDFIAVEDPDGERHQQGLWIGVRPIWVGTKPSEEPMIQICYQENYMHASLQGPVWITPQTWKEIDKAVKWRVKHYQRSLWNRYLDKLIGKEQN
jgi:hypothetical protein